MINLRPYQTDVKEKIFHAWKQGFKNVLLRMPTGCIHGDTIININRGGKGAKVTMRDLFMKSNGVASGRNYDMTVPTRVRSYLGDRIGLHLVENVVYSGVKAVWKLSLQDGKELIATPDHEIMTKRGFVQLKDLIDLDKVMIDTHLPVKSKKPLKRLRDVMIEGLKYHPYARPITVRGKPNKRIEKHRGIYEANLNKLSFDEYKRIIRHEPELAKTLKYVDPSLYDIHHLDYNHYNNKCINLIKLTKKEHLKLHGKINTKNFGQGELKYVNVKSVENLHKEVDTYDIICEEPNRNFTANGMIVHNSGKTKTFCDLVIDTLNDQTASWPTTIMVHRKELVQQICLTLAEEGISHNIIAATKDIKGIIAAERRMFGKQFYNPNATVTVISVDTLNARHDRYKNWCTQIRQVIVDEAAHVLKENKWGRALAYFKNARCLGVTATPERLDRKGLGSHADGVFDVMVEGPTTLWLMKNGYLSDYRIAIPESDYNKYLQSSSSTSDYSKKAMTEASNKSQIVGDVVENYVKFAKGKQAIVFASDVATARKMEKQFEAAGIIAKSLDGTTPDAQRLDALIKYREKKTQVLINVDLFDEGLDVPGIECVIMARPTKSLGKFLQTIGRGLRVAEGKPHLILIDHVGNVMEHGLPCKNRSWTLDRIKKSGKKLNFMRICCNPTCCSPYDRALIECPWCGEPAISASTGLGGGRVPPMQVDGDLFLIDPETMRELEAVSQLESPASVGDRVGGLINGAAGIAAMTRQRDRIEMQKTLSQAIAVLAGELRTHYGYTDRMIHKKFYLHHGQTITEVLGEPRADMEKTLNQVQSGGYY